jgi:TPP-dependent pyruvate/acetoin dehydrogenase alpha subunit
MERDQVTRTGALLAISVREAIESAVDAEIAEAFLFAEASPFPADDELMRNTYAD